jgi:two-component system sensor histidine kinase UhpB
MSGTDLEKRDGDHVAERNAGLLRALDLHDETGQLLTAILVNLRHLGKSVKAADAGETVRDTEHLVESLFYSIRNFLRDASGGVPAPALPRPELGPALRRLTRDFSRRTGIEVDMLYEPDTERVPGEHKAVFYRVVQESLTNVFRHTGARKVKIRFARSESSVAVEIEDDGGARPGDGRRHAPPADARASGSRPSGDRCSGSPAGFGLRGMRERVRIVGGECTVRMVENRGMTVRVVLPYNIS